MVLSLVWRCLDQPIEFVIGAIMVLMFLMNEPTIENCSSLKLLLNHEQFEEASPFQPLPFHHAPNHLGIPTACHESENPQISIELCLTF